MLDAAGATLYSAAGKRLQRLSAHGTVLAGGYAEDVRDTVEINAATAAAVAARMRRTPHVAAPRGWEADRSPN